MSASGKKRGFQVSGGCCRCHARGVPRYLVETYMPPERRAEARLALARLAASGGDVRQLHATFVPEDETSFCILEAPSLEAARDALVCAAVRYERIVEASASI